MRLPSLFRALCLAIAFTVLTATTTAVGAQETKPSDETVDEKFEIPAGSEPGKGIDPLDATTAPDAELVPPVSVEQYPPLTGDELGEVAATGDEQLPELTTERIDDRTVASELWETSNGGLTIRAFNDLKHFETNDGELVPIDLTLKPIKDRDGWVQTTANGFNVRFGPMSAEGPVEITTSEGQDITLIPTVPPGRINKVEMKIDAEAGIVTYLDIFPGVDLRYTATPTGVKEDVILNRPGNAARFETLVIGADINGSIEPETGLFLPETAKGQKERPAGAAIPGGLAVGAFLVEDSKGVPVDEKEAGASLQVAKAENSGKKDKDGKPAKSASSVVVEVSKDWLAKQPKDAFPIVIDPGYFASWAVGSNGGGYGSRFTGSGYYANRINVGNSMSYGSARHWRAQVRFENSMDGQMTFGDLAAQGWGVTSAQLNLTFWYANQTQRTIYAGWNQAGTSTASTGFNQMYPGYYASPNDKAVIGGSTGGNTGGPANEWLLPVTNVARKWLNEEVAETPWISLKGDESLNTTYTFKRFSQAALYINLEKKPSRPRPLTPDNNAVSLDTTPTLTALASSPQYTGQPIAHWFRVSTSPNVDDGNIVADSGWVGTTWTVPAGILQDGVKYYWNVKAIDTNYGIYHNTLPSEIHSLTINQRLGTGDSTQPYESFGPGTVNLANGNYVVSVGTSGFNSLGGAVSAGLTYNTQEEEVNGLVGTYYFDDNKNGLVDNGELPVMSRVERPHFNWGTGAPVPGHGRVDDFVVHWDGFMQVPDDGVYRMAGLFNDGAKIVVDGVTSIDSLNTASSGWKFGSTQTLAAGDSIPIHIEFREKTGSAHFQLSIQCMSGACLGQWPGLPTQWHAHVSNPWLSPTPTSLPKGWTLGTSTSGGRGWVRAEAAGNNVVLKDASGTSTYFEYISPGSWKPPTGNYSTLTKPEGSGYVLHSDDGFTYVFGIDGELLETSSPIDTANPTRTVQVFSNGRLSALKDPVSNREITFRYYGSDTCPINNAYTSEPSGMLCQIRYPDTTTDDTATSIWYSGYLISEIRNPGNEQYNFGWTIGQLTSLMDPFVNEAFRYSVPNIPAAADADWEISYTGESPRVL